MPTSTGNILTPPPGHPACDRLCPAAAAAPLERALPSCVEAAREPLLPLAGFHLPLSPEVGAPRVWSALASLPRPVLLPGHPLETWGLDLPPQPGPSPQVPALVPRVCHRALGTLCCPCLVKTFTHPGPRAKRLFSRSGESHLRGRKRKRG